uniref:Insulin-like domain-containing protein n=1 Tax=Salmo trutta TaxID=8032 RepID=A0A673XQG0_SALTR
SSNPLFYLCSTHLMDVLCLVCGENGFIYSILDQCCHKPCNIFDLCKYCN